MKPLPLIAALLLGTSLGIGLYITKYAQAASYLSSDPKTCVNCHIMQPQYDSWQRSSHHAVAGCIDCHLPHAFIPKMIAKSLNGYHHSKAFTLQDFPEPIRIKPVNSRILQENCLRCHADMVHSLMIASAAKDAPRCTHCHADAGHGERAGLGGPSR